MTLARTDSLIGKKFHFLKVISLVSQGPKGGSKVWKCRCKCGNETQCGTKQLESGNTRSCGCRMLRNRLKLKAGDVYGKLVVVGKVIVSGQGHTLWKCFCECGNVITLAATVITRG